MTESKTSLLLKDLKDSISLWGKIVSSLEQGNRHIAMHDLWQSFTDSNILRFCRDYLNEPSRVSHCRSSAPSDCESEIRKEFQHNSEPNTDKEEPTNLVVINKRSLKSPSKRKTTNSKIYDY